MRISLVFLILLLLFYSVSEDLRAVSEPDLLRQYLTVSEAKLNDSIDESVDLAGKALILARKHNLPKETSQALLILAKGYHKAGVYDKALDRCQQALRGFESINDQLGCADAYEQMGYIYWKLNNPDKVREYFDKSLALRRKYGNAEQIADALNNKGIVLLHYLKHPEEALKLYNEALSLCEKSHYNIGIAHSLNNIGNYYLLSGDYKLSLDYNTRSYELYKRVGDKNRAAINLLIIGYLNQLLGNEQLAEKQYFETIKLAEEVNSHSVVRDAYQNLSSLYQIQNKELKHLQYFKLYSELADSLYNKETNSNIANLQTQFAVEKQELENKILKLQNQRQKLLLLGLLLLISTILTTGYYIIREKRLSEKLLLNILPYEVAKELKRYGKSTPQTFENVSVLFSDFVNFTQISSGLPPEQLIDVLSYFFTEFDKLVEEYSCERIKTIGDAYLAVCGLPQAHPDHADRLLRVAMGMLEVVRKYNLKTDQNWSIRIGLHTGPVVGGIVGTRKYIYDVFGDSVNTASRMESNSEPMRINVSEDFYNRIEDKPPFLERPVSEVKGKGQMRMFFVSDNDFPESSSLEDV